MTTTQPDNTMFSPAVQVSVPASIYAQLLAAVRSGELPPGSKLPPERDLMKQFHVGRSSLREALRALTLAGVITVRPGSGSYVRAGNHVALADYQALALAVEQQTIEHLAEAREFLEAGTARLAASRRNDRDLSTMKSALAKMSAAAAKADVDTFTAADIDFHMAVAAATHNPVIKKLFKHIGELLVRSFRRSNADVSTLSAAVDRHNQILLAISKADAELAAKMTVANLAAARDLLAAYQPPRPDAPGTANGAEATQVT
jgi:GntR family transcriptional repressor for pyruvate dehydrogenase complex